MTEERRSIFMRKIATFNLDTLDCGCTLHCYKCLCVCAPEQIERSLRYRAASWLCSNTSSSLDWTSLQALCRVLTELAKVALLTCVDKHAPLGWLHTASCAEDRPCVSCVAMCRHSCEAVQRCPQRLLWSVNSQRPWIDADRCQGPCSHTFPSRGHHASEWVKMVSVTLNLDRTDLLCFTWKCQLVCRCFRLSLFPRFSPLLSHTLLDIVCRRPRTLRYFSPP